MRDYQSRKNNPFSLPHNLYMRVLYQIRDYDRMKEERMEILYSTTARDGLPRGNGVRSDTEIRAIRLVKVEENCKAVELALGQIPEEYRKGVIDNICEGAPFPLDASYSTYKRQRQRMIWWTAKFMGLCDEF
ncbi:MAG TPA: hypothetical protein IAB57_06345 [Candidatus Fimivivens faecavium]|nr:hypothetical protein [Candidatus Fimivivens faecavium]